MLRAHATAIVAGLGLAAVGLACASGCDPAGTRRRQLVSPYPLDRVRAAVQLAEAGDADAVDLLIELLNDRDRGVRMYAILALRRLCGETHGYQYYDAEPLRAAAVARWREARQRGEVTLRTRSPQSDEQSADPAGGLDRRPRRSP
ncbi:MAG: HEAT repeat domain-containing protein [Phycisphaerae bacterium]